MKKLLRITEAEVVAEFVKAELFHPQFDADRENFQAIVHQPNLASDYENAIRRALLFRRRATMWRELPHDVQWWEVEITPEDLQRIKIFPRAHWRQLAKGNYQASQMAEKVRALLDREESPVWLAKIRSLRATMQEDGPKSTMVLIGIDEEHPLRVLEGNHRFISAMLLSAEVVQRRLRVVAGFSPHMRKCCWYRTDLFTLIHYAKNRIRYMWSRDADVARLLQRRESSNGDYAAAATLPNGKPE